MRDLEISSNIHVRSVRSDNHKSSQTKYKPVFQVNFAWLGLVSYINVAFPRVCPAELCFTFLSPDYVSYSSSIFMFISIRHILHYFTEYGSQFIPPVTCCSLWDAPVKYQTSHHTTEVGWETWSFMLFHDHNICLAMNCSIDCIY